jgi:hypothetical protein
MVDMVDSFRYQSTMEGVDHEAIMTKSSAAKRLMPPAAGSWGPQAARVEALVLTNIEQAADLGGGYVIIKLRDMGVVRHQLGAPHAAELPIMSRERLVAALNRGSTLTDKKPRARTADNDAFMRSMAMQEQIRRAELEQSGQLISSQELAHRLGVTSQAVSKALKSRRLFALDGSGGGLLYPAFYADGKLSRRDLGAVTRALGDIPASSKWQFFTNPKSSLGGITPLDALQSGQREAVMVSAAGFVER